MTKTLTRRPAAALRRSLLENLETRRLMAATSASINFQPGGPATPAGMTADYGSAFGWQFGKQYGWNSNNKSNAVERRTAADNERDTFVKLGSGAATKWEIAVDNGTYSVNVVAGDASAYDSKYVINAENTTVVNGTPTNSNRWVSGTANVNVTDGRLTLTAGNGASNVKLTSVRFSKVGSGGTTAPTTPAPTTPTTPTTPTKPTAPTAPATSRPSAPTNAKASLTSANAATVTWGNVSNETGFIVEASTNNGALWTEAARVGADVTSTTISNLAGNKTYHFRVKAFNTAGVSNASNSPAVKTGNAPVTNPTNPTTPTKPTNPTSPTGAKPGSPTNASASLVSANSVKVSWNNVSNESGFFVEASTNNGAKWTEVARVGTDVTSATISNLSNGTTYHFRVKAFNAAGISGASNSPSLRTGTAPVTNPTPAKPSAPSAPSGLATSLASLNSVKLTWNNVANESGFIIERSTNNGGSWTEAGRVGADVTTATFGSLSYTTTYSWRIKAYNAGGTSGASSTVSIKTGTPTASGAGGEGEEEQTPPPTSGEGINSFAMSGIVQNEAEFNMANRAMKELGIKSVRLWYSVNKWTDGVNNWALDKAIQYKNAGYTVTLAVVGKNVADYNTTKAYFERLMDNGNAKRAVDYWEIGNEPNKAEYWKGSLQQYVNQNLKPAWDVLHAEGEKVIGGGVTWDVNALKQMVSYGYLNYCDYAGFHPYGETGAMVADRIKGAKAAVGNKPIIVTEWNIRLMTDANKWASELNVAAKALSQYSYLNYYYALEVDPAVKSTGMGGVIYSNGNKNTPFWNTVYNWIN